MTTAVYIPTELWNKIIKSLANDNWKFTYQYDGFDRGIDFNLMAMEKNGEKILFGWDNWDEGEIQCSETIMQQIEKIAGQELRKGEPSNLKPAVVGLYIK
jgi:hypothetical protein